MVVDERTSPENKLLFAVEGAERFRTRARSVATITATGAGALAAGLVLNSSSNFSLFTKTWGLVSIVFLLVATAVFVVASLVHPRTTDPEQNSWLRTVIRPWETLYSADGETTQARLLEQSDAVLLRILKAMDVGMWLAGVAILSLVVALVSISVAVPERYNAHVALILSKGTNSVCPKLPMSFPALVSKSDLDRDSPLVPVTVAADVCGAEGGNEAVLYLDRTSIQLSIDPNQQ